MKRIFLALFMLPALAVAQFVGRAETVASIGKCNLGATNRVAYVIDAESASTLGSGGGTVKVWARCDGSAWAVDEVGSVTDLDAYALLGGDADGQTIKGTNDVRTGSLALTETLAKMMVETDIDSSDITIGATAITMASGWADFSFDTNEFEVDLIDAGSAFDVAVNGTGSFINLLTSGTNTVITVDSGGTGSSTKINSQGNTTLSGGGSTVEMTLSNASVQVENTAILRLEPKATPPVACAAGTEGGLYLDSDTHLLCVCNATGWVQVADGTTGCS